jgi:hypothetical protein
MAERFSTVVVENRVLLLALAGIGLGATVAPFIATLGLSYSDVLLTTSQVAALVAAAKIGGGVFGGAFGFGAGRFFFGDGKAEVRPDSLV